MGIEMDIENVTSDGVLVFHQCLICEEQFLQFGELEEHRRSHVKVKMPSQNDLYQTTKNLLNEEHGGSLVKVEKPSQDVEEEEEAVLKVEEEEIHQCRLCGEEFNQYEQLERHCEIHLENEITSNEELVWHTCDICQELFPSFEELQAHKGTHKTNIVTTKLTENRKLKNIYKCDICGKRCKRPFDLTIHVRTHTGEKPVQREIRSKPPLVDFRRLGKANALEKDNQQDYMSNICGLAFRKQVNFNQHRKFHNGELQTHIRSHQEFKKFECNVCGKCFYGKSHLRNHSRIHTGEKPYQCHICQRAFNQAGNLRTHMKVHVPLKLKRPRIRPIRPKCETSCDHK